MLPLGRGRGCSWEKHLGEARSRQALLTELLPPDFVQS